MSSSLEAHDEPPQDSSRSTDSTDRRPSPNHGAVEPPTLRRRIFPDGSFPVTMAAAVAGPSPEHPQRFRHALHHIRRTVQRPGFKARTRSHGSDEDIASDEDPGRDPPPRRRWHVRLPRGRLAPEPTGSWENDDAPPETDSQGENRLLQKEKEEEEDMSHSSQRETSLVGSHVLTLGPWMDLLTADSTILLFLCVALVLPTTMQCWSILRQLPLSFVLSWMLLYATSLWRASGGELEPLIRRVQSLRLTRHATAVPRSTLVVAASRPDGISASQRRPTRSHSILMRVVGRRYSSIRVKKFSDAMQTRIRQAWTTTLDASHSQLRLPYERYLDLSRQCTSKNNVLVQRLLRNADYGRVPVTMPKPSHPAGPTSIRSSDHSLGKFELSPEDVETLDEFMLVPLLKLRGMDVMLADGDPESEVSTHPFLTQHGLRDVPSLNINIMTSWANIVLYFQLPEWMTSWDSAVESEDDAPDTKALKRFVNGNIEYRSQRLKIIPSLVDGPYVMKCMAPPTREIVVGCDTLPLTWLHHDADASRGYQIAMEVVLDCVTFRSVRTATSLMKRHLKAMCMDIALIIAKPDNQVEDEPQACVGMWRFDHIDLSQCSRFPDRTEYEAREKGQDADMLRASKIIGIDVAVLQELAVTAN